MHPSDALPFRTMQISSHNTILHLREVYNKFRLEFLSARCDVRWINALDTTVPWCVGMDRWPPPKVSYLLILSTIRYGKFNVLHSFVMIAEYYLESDNLCIRWSRRFDFEISMSINMMLMLKDHGCRSCREVPATVGLYGNFRGGERLRNAISRMMERTFMGVEVFAAHLQGVCLQSFGAFSLITFHTDTSHSLLTFKVLPPWSL